jgi:uncharacterized protein YoxC
MEPFKALTFLAAAGIVSAIGVGAAGFYAGYSAGRGDLSEIKSALSGASVQAPQASAPLQAQSAAAPVNLKPVLEEIRSLATKLDGLNSGKREASSPQPETRDAAPPAVDLGPLRADLRDLAAKIEQSDSKPPKALLDEIRILNDAVKSQEPQTRKLIADELKSVVAAFKNSEMKPPQALVDEVRRINASVQAQTAQDPKTAQTLLSEIKTLNAGIDALKAKVPATLLEEVRGLGDQIQELVQKVNTIATVSRNDSGKTDPGMAAELGQLRQLVSAAAEQFGKCQTQLASYTPTALPATQGGGTGSASAATARQDPSSIVLYDNVVLKKDQEKPYEEIGVRLSLQSIGPRQVRVGVNRQAIALGFGERKVFKIQDVECELNLMETDLNDGQARVSIACKR